MHLEYFRVDIDIVTNPYGHGWTFRIDFNEEGYKLFKKEVKRLKGETMNSDTNDGTNDSLYEFIYDIAMESLIEFLKANNDPMADVEELGCQWEWIDSSTKKM